MSPVSNKINKLWMVVGCFKILDKSNANNNYP